jgi:glutathione reductase (NADPH)
MTKTDSVYDLIVIGTGVAASTVAWECYSAGWKIAIIDSRPFGGTCALRGCDPKKVLVGAAEVIDWNHRMGDKGISNTNDIHIKWPELMHFKRSFTEPVPKAREDQFSNAAIATFHGHASFTDATTIKVTEKKDGGGTDHVLNGKYILVATGAKPAKLNIPGEEHVTISDQFLDLDYLPDRIVFIGGGYISFEFAHIAARAGAKKITILHRSNKPLGQFDPDLVSQLIQSTRETGIDVQLQTEVKGIAKSSDNGLTVNAFYIGENGNKTKEEHIIETDMVVHGAGRVPDVETLDLEAAGIEYDKKKGIKVNEYLQSVSNPAIYAAGDVVVGSGGPQLTPVATYDGKIVASNLLKGNHIKPNYTGVPSVVFTIPPLASVGLQESAAKEQGLHFKINFKKNTSGWYTSRRIGESHSGFKVLVEQRQGNATITNDDDDDDDNDYDSNDGRVLGAHLLGTHAEEIINIFALAIRLGLDVTDIKDAILSYPTKSSDIGYML